MLTDNLSQIIKDCWSGFQQLKNLPTTVKPSIPILWFGDLEAYGRSKIKILTVALNPSDMEFQIRRKDTYDVGVRFPAATKIAKEPELDDAAVEAYCRAMNEYFEKNPYTKWFNRLEKPLNELGATYYANDPAYVNRAVHIDIYTPIATTPTWGKLSPEQQAEYEATSKCFEQLRDVLSPDVILISTNQTVIHEKLGVALPAPGQQPYIVNSPLPNCKTLVAGRNMRGTPFGGMTDEFIHNRMSAIRPIVAQAVLNEQLYDAAFDGKLDDVKRLLQEGADPNYADEDGYTPLMRVVEEGWIECARVLIDAGANVHATNNLGETAIAWAVRPSDGVDVFESIPGKIQCIKLLLENGVDVDASDNRNSTPIMTAASTGMVGLLPTLFEAGANVNLPNQFGMTALMMAAGNSDDEAVDMLLKAGANADARDEEDRSALDIARAVNADECVQLLMAHGAH